MMSSKTSELPRRALLLSIILIAAGLTMGVPTAMAHSCTAEKGEPNEADCNTPCTEGEDHSHKVTHHHENGFGEDVNHIHYECKSKRDVNEPDCLLPRVLGRCLITDFDRLLRQTFPAIGKEGLSP